MSIKGKKLAVVILEYLLISVLISLFVFCFLYFLSGSIVENYFWHHGIVLTEVQKRVFSVWLRSVCGLAGLIIFVVLFLFMLGQRLSYLIQIIQGVELLKEKEMETRIPLEGDDELTRLAETINFVAASRRELDQRERQMQEEKEAWVRSMSHDIRTPLSIILAYASEMEETPTLPEKTRKQAGIILRQSEKLKNLVSDLNLTTKLEYSMQAICKQNIDAVELARQVISGILNDGMSDQHDIEFHEEQPGKAIQLNGDNLLLQRMLGNLIRNSIVHNPSGCMIKFSIGIHDNSCVFVVSDNGHGMSETQLNALNSNEDISSSQNSEDDTEHGLGLKIVSQIVKAHRGSIQFTETIPHGLTVKILLPMK